MTAAMAAYRTREVLLLVASYAFYAACGLSFLPILILSSIANFALGRYLRQRPSPGRLWLGIAFNLGLLSLFKYLPLAGALPWPAFEPLRHIALPLGASFWTFQALSYLLDLYREEELDPSLLEFCLYMAFFPTVISGPICRLTNLLPQFRSARTGTPDQWGCGILRILTGLLMMIASQVLAKGMVSGAGVDGGFARPAASLGGLDIWCLALGYGFQLFFSFAGYSHIAIGVAGLFGIRLAENFDRPYLATTVSEFWTRWHMSLSFWIRDYVFFPLATLRRAMWWRIAALVIAMFVFGLWHQGSVLFMLWGTYHGLLLASHRVWQQVSNRWTRRRPSFAAAPAGWTVTLAAVTVGWIFFRAESLAQAVSMLHTLVSPGRYRLLTLPAMNYLVTLLAMAGYFGVVAVSAGLDRWSPAAGGALDELKAGPPASGSRAMVAFARDRWVWILPIAAVASLYVLTLVQLNGPLVGPMMYQVF